MAQALRSNSYFLEMADEPDAADYFAVAAIAAINDIDVETLSHDTRRKLVHDFRAGLSNWLRYHQNPRLHDLKKYAGMAYSDETRARMEQIRQITPFPEIDRSA